VHEIPASLRFPPPASNARVVTPTGQLVAPGWSTVPIALPETVSRSLLEHQVAPQYPEQALRMGVDGPVVLQASIGKDGTVRELKLVSGYLVLAHAAVDAVKQWRYKPYRTNGENVEIETLITVNFKRPPRG
jgi:protein TonB